MMFDAKSLLDVLVKGASPGSAQGATSAGGLDDLLRQISGGGGAGSGSGSGGLADVLGNLQSQIGKASPGGGNPGGGLLDVLGQVLGQATDGVKDGAQRIDRGTGASRHLGEVLSGATGKSPDELLQQVKDLVANNRMGVGAVLGSLGTILLGTQSGRAASSTAARIGTIAMIGGLAWKAYQNHLQGKPLLGGASGLVAEPAPEGSGFEEAAVENRHAIGFIRAMVAAAAADGRLDSAEQERLLGNLKEAGLDAAAEEFLANELNNPATVSDLAALATTPEEALQLYTAARLAVDVDTEAERSFLAALAGALGLEAGLVRQVNEAALSA